MDKLKALLRQLLRSPREFPVEAALGLVFFGIAAWHTAYKTWDETVGSQVSDVNQDILFFFVPLLVLTFYLGKVNRWLYALSGLLFLPLMALNLKPFLWTYGFYFTYVLAAILLIVGTRRMDNRPFGAHVLHVVTQLFFGLLLSAILTMAVVAIVGSVEYIFSLSFHHVYEYIYEFIWFAVAPQICCTLISRGENEVSEPAKVIQIILNYILSPAIVIYTVILYVYFIKIAFEWNLPKGGVAWLVMGFITAALVGCLAQYVLDKRYFDWFYRHFTWIAIPPLIMYWIGSFYRIRMYSFTESRFYLMVAGVLMTLFVLMLLWRHTRRFQLMVVLFGFAIILFTYIPGISAKSIGLRCQTERMRQLMSELRLTDPRTGKLLPEIPVSTIVRDSVLCERYREACNVIGYVHSGMEADKFKRKYGVWNMHEYQFNYQREELVPDLSEWYELTTPVDLGEYRVMAIADDYTSSIEEGRFVVRDSRKKVVIDDPVSDRIAQDSLWREHLPRVMMCRNDSLLIVLRTILVTNDSVRRYTYNNCIYKKR